MEYFMHLEKSHFQKIKHGVKKYEIRLYDKKRKLLKVGDIIKFINRETREIIKLKVINLVQFKNLEELLKEISVEKIGFEDTDSLIKVYKNIYSQEEIFKYGFLVIETKNQSQ